MEDKNTLKHIAIIMDGNGRWAQQRNLPISRGHKKGAEKFVEVAKFVKKAGIKYLTVYAFSKENWNRDKKEVGYLMSLTEHYLDSDLKELIDNKVKVRFLGSKKRLKESMLLKMQRIENLTKDFDELHLNICFNYSGREEITEAVQLLHKDIANNKIDINTLDEDMFRKYLYNPNIPDPDLIIRTGGEMRVSNFLLWYMAYSEFYSTTTFWPDFAEKDLYEAIENFKTRKRNYGRRKAK